MIPPLPYRYERGLDEVTRIGSFRQDGASWRLTAGVWRSPCERSRQTCGVRIRHYDPPLSLPMESRSRCGADYPAR